MFARRQGSPRRWPRKLRHLFALPLLSAISPFPHLVRQRRQLLCDRGLQQPYLRSLVARDLREDELELPWLLFPFEPRLR